MSPHSRKDKRKCRTSLSGGFDASFPFGESLRKDVFPGRTGGTLDLRLK